jgi:hypothetical protein
VLAETTAHTSAAKCSAFFDFTSRESGRIVFNLRHRQMRIPTPTVVAGTGAARATGRLLLPELPVEDVVVCIILGAIKIAAAAAGDS